MPSFIYSSIKNLFTVLYDDMKISNPLSVDIFNANAEADLCILLPL